MPAHPDLAGANVELPREPGSEMRLRDALGGVRERFDYVLLDCPPSLGPLTVNALVAADRVIVPVQTEYFALEGLAGLLDTLALIQRELNPRLTIAGMLLTMHDGRTRLARDVEREVREHFPSLVFDTVIPRNVRVGEAPSYGRPVTHHDPHCAGSDAYFELAKEVVRAGRVLSPPQRGMGRGLAAILAVSGGRGPELEDLRMIPVELIAPNPKQPRRVFDDAALEALAGSLRERGVLQPVLVRPVAGGTYELVAGERRWRAARLAGLDTIPALVRARDDAEALEAALIENMAREDLNPVEEARACAALVEELGLTRETVGLRVGRSRVAVSNLLRLLDLPDEALALHRARRPVRGPRPRAPARDRSRRPPPPRAVGRRRRLVGPRAGGQGARGQRARRARVLAARPRAAPCTPIGGRGGSGDRGRARRRAGRRGHRQAERHGLPRRDQLRRSRGRAGPRPPAAPPTRRRVAAARRATPARLASRATGATGD